MDTVSKIEQALKQHGQAEKVPLYQRFFKTGPGEYAEGDKFLCVSVPDQRNIVKQYRHLVDLDVIINLLQTDIHEYRLTALLFLVDLYQREKNETKKQTYVDFYLEQLDWVNHWDLVDSTAHKILGDSLRGKPDKSILRTLAKRDHLWRQRVSIVANWTIMKDNDYDELLWVSEYFLNHQHDLIHKAVGWMLREMGKRDVQVLHTFLRAHAHQMPRTMLRYAIERLDIDEKHTYLSTSS
jgi:3-methyladenine DNA glycosylase AlkD